MAIKLIAVDMDGTFLDSQMTYDQERFLRQYQKMQERGIRFVVASGNQYYQLKSFFGEVQDEITYVAENGGLIMDKGEEVFSVSIPREDVQAIVEELVAHEQLSVILCGKASAYTLDSVPEHFFAIMNKYYRRLKRVSSFEEVDDQILKFALATPLEQTRHFQDLLHEKIGTIITPVSSGHGSIDLIMPNFHKAHGIQLLQKRWGIRDEETMAFGDGGNDMEMLQHVRYGFVMANASEEVKGVAAYRAPSHNESGVLEVIDHYLADPLTFEKRFKIE